MDHPKLQEVLKVLQEDNVDSKQIEEILSEIIRASYSKMYSQAMLSLTEADLESIEKADDENVDQEIMYFYKLRTGKDPDEEVKQFITDFADAFLKEYLSK